MKCLLPAQLLFFLLFSLTSFAQNDISSFNILTSDPEKSIIRNTETSVNHKTLLAAMRASDMEEMLSYDGPYTVFAPSDMAFEKLTDINIAELLDPKNKKKLHQVLSYHIVAGYLSAAKILRAMCRGEGKAVFTTVQGDNIIATMSGIDIILTDTHGNTAKIITADSNQCNGVIHEIDSVILPKKI
ncbi:MAG: fasciclin domain-containing protein [Flavobacteriaceae bacterium]